MILENKCSKSKLKRKQQLIYLLFSNGFGFDCFLRDILLSGARRTHLYAIRNDEELLLLLLLLIVHLNLWFDLNCFSPHNLRSHMFSYSFHDSVFSLGSLSFCSFSIKMNHKIATCRHLRFWFISPSSFCTDFFFFGSLNMISFCDIEFRILNRFSRTPGEKKTMITKKNYFSLVFSILLLFQLIYLYFEINAQDHVFK